MKNKNNKGFSLLELLVVIAVVAALVVFAIPAYANMRAPARNAAQLEEQAKAKREEAASVLASIPLSPEKAAASAKSRASRLMAEAGESERLAAEIRAKIAAEKEKK